MASDLEDIEALLDSVGDQPRKPEATEERVKERKRSKDRDSERKDRKKSRSRDRESRRRQSRSRSSSRERPRRRGISRDRDRDRDREKKRSRDRRDRDTSRDRSRSRSREKKERERERSRERRERNKERESTAKAEREKNSAEEAERERLREIERQERKKKKEIDDLTKDQRTIFVGQLVAKVNEQHLQDFFETLGPVNNVIMIRDKGTGRHKGFAYVEMGDLETIPNCLLFHNVVPDFQKFPILVKASEAEKNFLAKKESSAKADGSGPDSRLYLGNLHPGLSDADLKTILIQFGPVDYVNLHRDELGNSKGFAFTRYARAEDAVKALERLQGFDIGGKLMKVGPVIDQKSVLNAGAGLTAGAIPSVQDTSGQTASANWKLDDDEGAGLQLNSQSRAMLMAKLGQAAGIQVPAPTLPAPMQIQSVSATPPIGGIPSKCFYVRNMFDISEEMARGDDNWDDDIRIDVTEECEKFGKVEHCHVEKRQPGGIVYLRFLQEDASVKAASSLNGRFFAGRMISVAYIPPEHYERVI